MIDMPDDQISRLPYTVLLDPLLDRGAAFNRHGRLITDDASRELVLFSRTRHVHQAAWHNERHGKHQMPEWATPEVLTRCVLVWVQENPSTSGHLATIPKT